MISGARAAVFLSFAWTLASTASAAVALLPRWAVDEWVTVDGDGKPHTLAPSVTTVNGAVKTVSGPPYLLTGTVFTVTSGTHVATTTAKSPLPPTATATSGAGGIFAVCSNKVGDDSPFCQPRAGSSLSVGKTYYVTWDASYFGDQSDRVFVSARYLPSRISVFDSIEVPASQGYMPWTPDRLFLQGRGSNNLMITLTYEDDNGEDKILEGPLISIVEADISIALPKEKKQSSGPSTASKVGTAVGVVVGVLLIAAVLFFCWRRNRDRLILRAIRRRSSQGYGIGKSRHQRFSTAKSGIDSIQLDESPTSPTPQRGQNVFREEIQRQERDRR